MLTFNLQIAIEFILFIGSISLGIGGIVYMANEKFKEGAVLIMIAITLFSIRGGIVNS